MTPSNAGDSTSGFSFLNQNTPVSKLDAPSIPQSRSSLSRQRLAKVKRRFSSRNLGSTKIYDEGQDILGSNPFRNIRENLVTASSMSETHALAAAESGFGKSGNDAVVFGSGKSGTEEFKILKIRNDNNSKGWVLNSSSSDNSGKETFVFGANTKNCVNVNDLDSSVTNRKRIIEDLKNLKIGNSGELVNAKCGTFDLSSCGKLNLNVDEREESGNVAYGIVNTHNFIIDENVEAKLREDMRKLKIESHMSEDHRETVKDGKKISSVKDKLRSSNNVTGSLEKNLESELPGELQRKLNLKETGKLGTTNIKFNAVDANKFEFGSSRKDADSSAKSIDGTLHSHMKNLNIKDHLNTNNENNLASRKNVDGRKETIMSSKMEELNVGGRAADSTWPDGKTTSFDAFASDMPTGYVGDIKSFNLDRPKQEEFIFHGGTQVKRTSGREAPPDQPQDDMRMRGNAASSSSFSFSGIRLETVRSNFEVPEKRDECTFLSNQSCLEMPSFEFKTPNRNTNSISNFNDKLEFSAKRDSFKDARLKKKSGKSRQTTKVHLCHGQDFILRGSNSKEILEASDSYSPMDISPFHESLADNQYSRENSVTSDESSSCNLPTDSVPTNSLNAVDVDVLMATERLNINNSNTCKETKNFTESRFDGCFGHKSHGERSVTMAETESFKSAMEDVDFIINKTATLVETEASSSSNIKTHYSDCRTQFGFASSSKDVKVSNFTFSASSSTQSQSTASKRLNRKKSLAKLGQDTNIIISSGKAPYTPSSVPYIPFSGSSLLMSPGSNQKDLSHGQHKCGYDCGVDKGQAVKQESDSSSAAAAAQEACEKWRSRGNQAYTAGDLSKAEDFYSQGVNSVSRGETSKSCLRALMLCYGNRAATRMSLERMRDALSDCSLAAEIDPNFLRVQLRAANCYLALGEVEDASQHYKRCLQPVNDVCVDRKIAVEASGGLQNVQKVYECIKVSAQILQRKTSNEVGNALALIAEALIISPFSEELLKMKAEALFLIQSYEEAIGLCEQTFDSAEKNIHPLDDDEEFANLDCDRLLKYFYFRFWRSQIILKSYFHLGRLEDGLTSLEKQEKKLPITYRERKILESSLPLSVTVRELLHYKTAGNEAFQAGMHAEAVEHYTTALSCSVESRPFAAVCFCNRAAAYKALGQITDAIADCSLAMALDRNYGKAISRRATLFEMIRDYGQAITDLHRLVSLLTKKVEQKTGQFGVSDRSHNCTSDLRQARLRLSEIDDEAKRVIPLDMYLILGVEPFASSSEIKRAYRKAALRHHPDKAGQFFSRSDNGDDGLWKEIAEEVYKDADRLFKMIGEAYAVLSDPTKRARYDTEEETRNAQKKWAGSSSSRAPADVPFERSGSRQHWREVWNSYGKSSSKGAKRLGRVGIHDNFVKTYMIF